MLVFEAIMTVLLLLCLLLPSFASISILLLTLIVLTFLQVTQCRSWYQLLVGVRWWLELHALEVVSHVRLIISGGDLLSCHYLCISWALSIIGEAISIRSLNRLVLDKSRLQDAVRYWCLLVHKLSRSQWSSLRFLNHRFRVSLWSNHLVVSALVTNHSSIIGSLLHIPSHDVIDRCLVIYKLLLCPWFLSQIPNRLLWTQFLTDVISQQGGSWELSLSKWLLVCLVLVNAWVLLSEPILGILVSYYTTSIRISRLSNLCLLLQHWLYGWRS